MPTKYQELKKGFKRNLFGILFAASVYILGAITSFLAGLFLKAEYPELIRSADVILDNVPEMPIFVPISEVALAILTFSIFYKFFQKNFDNFPSYITKLGTVHTLRALSIVLTPLAQIQDPTVNGSNPILAEHFYQGMFYSGHTAIAFLIFFEEKDSKKLKFIKFLLASTVAISVILSHSHYSIDVFGGIVVAYAVSTWNIDRLISKFKKFLKRK
jgi:membrane-associated phospholipid phosphatase